MQLTRRIARRFPFSRASALFAPIVLPGLAIAPISLRVWFHLGGRESSIGLALIVLWTVGAILKSLMSALQIVIFRHVTKLPHSYGVGQTYATAILALVSAVCFCAGSMELGVICAFLPGAANIRHGIVNGNRLTSCQGLLSAAVPIAVVLRPEAAFAFSAINGVIELIRSASNSFIIYTRPILDLIEDRPTRVEYGLEALKGCPIGGG